MKLFKISQTVNTGYDAFDSAIVRAVDADAAKQIHPATYDWLKPGEAWCKNYPCWAITPDQVIAEEIGTAPDDAEEGVVLASFNAG